MWQSLSHGANYKSAYCMAVCPAGEDVIGPYLQDKQRHLNEVVRPLQERAEPVYVVPGLRRRSHRPAKIQEQDGEAGQQWAPAALD